MRLIVSVLLISTLAMPALAKKTPNTGGLPEVAAAVDSLIEQVNDIISFLDDLNVTPPVTHLSIDCDAGDSLVAAVAGIADGGTIDVSGTCNERVIIDGRYGITINGGGTATVDGNGLAPDPWSGTFAGLVHVMNSDDIALTGLTITNGPDAGLFVTMGSDVHVSGCAVHGNSFDGMDVFGSSFVNVANSGFDNNGRDGVLAGSSTIYYAGHNTHGGNGGTGISLISTDVMIFAGLTRASHNGLTGFAVNDGSVVQVEGSGAAEANHNGVWGMLMLNGSNLQARGNIDASYNQQGVSLRSATLNSTNGATLSTQGNTFGLLLESSSYYSNENSTVTSSDNQFGMLLRDSTVQFDSAFGLPELPVTIVDNDLGIYAFSGSQINIARPATISGNNTGVQLEDSVLRLEDESFGGNTLDINAFFGSKLDFHGSASVGSKSCDNTVLVRGTSC